MRRGEEGRGTRREEGRRRESGEGEGKKKERDREGRGGRGERNGGVAGVEAFTQAPQPGLYPSVHMYTLGR